MGSVQDLSLSSEQDFVLSDIEIESKINPKDNGQKNILNESENGSKVEINITTPEEFSIRRHAIFDNFH